MAAILNFQIGSGAVGGCDGIGFERRRGEDVAGLEDIAGEDLAVVRKVTRFPGIGDQLGNLCLMGITNHPFDAVHLREFIGRALGVAAGYENAGGGIFAADTADGGPRIVVRGRSDRAGVQDDDIGCFAGWREGKSASGDLGFERGAIGLCGAASEVLHEELPMGHMLILAESFTVQRLRLS